MEGRRDGGREGGREGGVFMEGLYTSNTDGLNQQKAEVPQDILQNIIFIVDIWNIYKEHWIYIQ